MSHFQDVGTYIEMKWFKKDYEILMVNQLNMSLQSAARGVKMLWIDV